ncbi:xylulokinase [soil metagenome]
MPEPLRHVPEDSIILGWDFSTGAVKCLAFDVTGKVIAESRFPTDLWTEGGVSELNLFQLEGQAMASVRAIKEAISDTAFDSSRWITGGISATHHTAARMDHAGNPIRRAICWNDQTLAEYHAIGLERLGGMKRVREFIGGPWAERYSLSHLLKDEATLTEQQWKDTVAFATHGTLAAGYLTQNFCNISISSAASTGMMDLRTNQWSEEMLGALANPQYREWVWEALPHIYDGNEPHGGISSYIAYNANLADYQRPLIFPTLDDQAAGLIGGGATDAGHVAIILGNSAVVNSSADFIPENTSLDVMKLNWGPYLWMRCYSNGAQFLDRVVGSKPNWPALEAAAKAVPAGCDGVSVLPFALSEPSIGVKSPRVEWLPKEPENIGVKVRASFEALAYLIALAVKEHEAAGQTISRISVSGGIAKSDLMIEILASVINKPLERLESDEGPALGAAVAALAGLESYRRKEAGDMEPYTVADAVQQMVRFKETVQPRAEWVAGYQAELAAFQKRIA